MCVGLQVYRAVSVPSSNQSCKMAHNNSKFGLEAVRAENRARPCPSGNAVRREQGEDLRACGARRCAENEMKFGAGQDVG